MVEVGKMLKVNTTLMQLDLDGASIGACCMCEAAQPIVEQRTGPTAKARRRWAMRCGTTPGSCG